jgi:hypothetical protein
MELHFILAPHQALLQEQYGQIRAGNGTLAQALAAGFAIAGITMVPSNADIMVALQRPRPAAADNVF